MIKPIPFAGLVESNEELDMLAIDQFIKETYGKNPENMPKYVVLGDGSFYIFHREEHRYALQEPQRSPLQEGIPATTGAGGATQAEHPRAGTLCYGQEGRGQNG